MRSSIIDIIVEQTTGKSGGRTVIVVLVDGAPKFGGPMADLFQGIFDRCLATSESVPCSHADGVFNGNSMTSTRSD